MEIQFIAKVVIEAAIIIIIGIAVFGFVREFVKERRAKIEKEYKQILKEVKKQ